MRQHNSRVFTLMLAIFCLTMAACSKTNTGSGNSSGNGSGGNNSGGNGGNNSGNNNGTSSTIKGTIYIDWATSGLLKIDLATGQRSTVIANMIPVRAVDISKDNTKMLTCTDAGGTDYDDNLITLSNISDATIISQFKYYATNGDFVFPALSPDATMLGLPPTFDDGIVILDTKGNIIKSFASFNGNSFGDMFVWMPDNTFLFSTGASLYRSNAALTQGNKITQFNFTNWGDVAASPDGTKIALKGGNHIWLMNVDGSNLTQVTTSTFEEAYPVFSPDSKYLLVGTYYQETSEGGHIWYLKIIPADGKQYDVDDNADKNVIPVIAKGDTKAQPGSGTMLWR